MKKVNVHLHPMVRNLNLTTVIKTAVPPGDMYERLFIATQVGEIYNLGNGVIETFLDLRSRIIELGTKYGGYDERGLLGLAFHPLFYDNGLFYLHYSVAGTQGPGALPQSFQPNPCDPETLNLSWNNRETHFDHIDTVEEWAYQPNSEPQKLRTLLNLRRPFFNHNGVNSLNFSPETGRLVLTTGDGGSGFDPFNLSQDIMEIAGKIIEIDTDLFPTIADSPVVTRFDELPTTIQETLTVIAKGVRNIPGISYQQNNDQYIKYVGNVGQELIESIFSFIKYEPVPVTQLTSANSRKSHDQVEPLNLGWRGWEGDFPSLLTRNCSEHSNRNETIIAYYKEAVETLAKHIHPITSYFHNDPRPDKFEGTALTGVQSYMGSRIPDLREGVIFIDFAKRQKSQSPIRGALAYTRLRNDCHPSDFSEIDIDYDFGPQAAYYVTLGSDLDQSRLFLGVYGSANVTDYNLGTVFEIAP